MLLVIALLAAQAQGGADPTIAKKGLVKPLSNPGTWLTADDFSSFVQRYPSAMIAFQMTVGPDGKLSDCTITTSSGSPEIDHLTCSMLRRRAHFQPVRDSEGKPATGNYIGRFSWGDRQMSAPRAAALDVSRTAQQVPSANGLVQAKPRTTVPWITNDDYPAADARQHHEGTVGFALQIDASGRATRCDVTASSGYPGLDNGACVLLLRRARFDPARDAGGKAVASTFPGRFTWRLGKGAPARNGVDGSAGSEAPPAPGGLDIAVAALPTTYKQPVKAKLRFGEDRRVNECSIEESSGNSAIDQVACGQARKLIVASPSHQAETAEYVITFRVGPPPKP